MRHQRHKNNGHRARNDGVTLIEEQPVSVQETFTSTSDIILRNDKLMISSGPDLKPGNEPDLKPGNEENYLSPRVSPDCGPSVIRTIFPPQNR
jgi:hypothetical protein